MRDGAGGHSGRSERAILNIDLVGHDLGGRKTFGKFGGMLPIVVALIPSRRPDAPRECTRAYRAISPFGARRRAAWKSPLL